MDVRWVPPLLLLACAISAAAPMADLGAVCHSCRPRDCLSLAGHTSNGSRVVIRPQSLDSLTCCNNALHSL
jgi:hypothetical protein